MRFILLGAGKIAERFVSQERFAHIIQHNLAGLIASQPVIGELGRLFDLVSPSWPICYIRDKRSNEEDLSNLIRVLQPDYLLSIQYSWILPHEILFSVQGRVVNLHNARLPDYRGYNSISYEILNEETIHTSTLHLVNEEVDRGRILKIKEIPIRSDDTAYSLWLRSVDSALSLLEVWFADFSRGLSLDGGTPANLGGAYYPKDISNQKRIPAGATAEVIDKWARAFWFPPYEPAFIQCGHRKLYVLPKTWNYQVD